MYNKFTILGSTVYIDMFHSTIVQLAYPVNIKTYRLKIEITIYADDFKKNEYRLPILMDVIQKHIKDNYPNIDNYFYYVYNRRGLCLGRFFDINDFKQTIFQNVSIGV